MVVTHDGPPSQSCWQLQDAKRFNKPYKKRKKKNKRFLANLTMTANMWHLILSSGLRVLFFLAPHASWLPWFALKDNVHPSQ
jgi:hypothetical protein